MGVEKKFKVAEAVSVTPFVETVWMDSRRYQQRYGGIPQDRFLGGAFATMTSGVVLDWEFAKDWHLFSRLRQYDIINSQSRRAVKKQDAYYAKCDQFIFSLGLQVFF